MEQSKVGVLAPTVQLGASEGEYVEAPIYNALPPRGYAANFISQIAFPQLSLVASVRSDDYGIRVTAVNTPNIDPIFGALAFFEGQPSGATGAFLTNPSDCSESANGSFVSASANTYQEPIFPSPSLANLPPLSGCDNLTFEGNLGLQPFITTGAAPTGVEAKVTIPQDRLLNSTTLANPPLKRAEVILPEGLTLNAAAASTLQGCSETQIGYLGTSPGPNPTRFDDDPAECPDASKLGALVLKTPLLEESIEGTVYLANQEENPSGSLIAIYADIESPRFGLNIKLPGVISPDSTTGRLTATFDYLPQLPFEEFTLKFRGGATGPLATPEVCGSYETTGQLTPWSAPESGQPVQIDEKGFTVSTGCASSAAVRRFAPSFESGTVTPSASSYSPLVVKIARKDGEQELDRLNFTLPRGLLGKIAGIPYCSAESIRSAELTSGKAEQSSPSCPADSRIGRVDATAGVGTLPVHVVGDVYLAGPYRGAPLSAVAVTPAVAGPFDLGDVVIRASLYVDPETSQIAARSDQVPTILRGVPLKLQTVTIVLDRPDFVLNPTSCEPTSVNASILGSSGATATPSDHFQVTGCDKLAFKPKLKIGLKGSTTRTGHPALTAVLSYPQKGAYANIARAQVNLPHSEFLAQGNLNKTCTKPVLLEGKCPKLSIYGRAEAWTPLLEKPLQGPVYLVGGYGYKLPALVADLDGQLRIVLKGKVDTGGNKGIRNTFEAVPDAPVSRFVLQLKGGKKYGLLENSENLCAKPQRAISRFTAQNGLVRKVTTRIARRCLTHPRSR